MDNVYHFTVDYKVEVWMREYVSVHAVSQEDAEELLKSMDTDEISEHSHDRCDVLYETQSEPLEFEVRNVENDRVIISRKLK